MPGTHRSTCRSRILLFTSEKWRLHKGIQLAGIFLGTQPTTRVFIPNDLRRKLQPGCQADSGAVFAGVYTFKNVYIPLLQERK